MLSPKALAAAALFGLAALVIVAAGLTIPIAATQVVTDPREIFTTLGSALSGPVGGMIVGVLAGVDEAELRVASVLAHVAGGLWMGFAYKRLVYERLDMPAMLAGWAAIVLVYYFVFLVTGFSLGQVAAAPTEASFGAAYATLAQGAIPEAAFTIVVTSIALVALPASYRKPLW